MNYVLLHCVFGYFLSAVLCNGSPCNDYMDKILNDLKENKEHFQDPYDIPEKSLLLHKKLLFMNYTGEAKFYDGYIFGLTSLHRDGDVIVRKNSTHFTTYLGAGELELQCKGTVKLMGFGPEVIIKAILAYVNLKLDVIQDSNKISEITNFNIEDIKGFKVKVSGLGPLNFILNNYVKVIRMVFSSMIRQFIESRLKMLMNKNLKDYAIPEDCINDKFAL